MTSQNGECKKELKSTNRKEKVFKREIKYGLRLLERDETYP
jgi:hypothetical protein